MFRKVIDFIFYWVWCSWRYRKVRIIISVVYNPADRVVFETVKAENRNNKVRNRILGCPDTKCPVGGWYLFVVEKKTLKLEREMIKLTKERDKKTEVRSQ